VVEYIGDRIGRCGHIRAVRGASVWPLVTDRESDRAGSGGGGLFCWRRGLTFGWQGVAPEIAGMNAFEIFAVAWIPVSVAIIIGLAFSFDWIEDRLSGRKLHHPAE